MTTACCDTLVNANEFRQSFLEFSDASKYPETLIQSSIRRACEFIQTHFSVSQGCCDRMKTVAELLVAHIVWLSAKAVAGIATPGQVASTSIGDVSVSMVTPQNKSAFQYWLNQSPYGQELLALLATFNPFGMYVGGSKQKVL